MTTEEYLYEWVDQTTADSRLNNDDDSEENNNGSHSLGFDNTAVITPTTIVTVMAMYL